MLDSDDFPTRECLGEEFEIKSQTPRILEITRETRDSKFEVTSRIYE